VTVETTAVEVCEEVVELITTEDYPMKRE